jgi:hypothetical protein
VLYDLDDPQKTVIKIAVNQGKPLPQNWNSLQRSVATLAMSPLGDLPCVRVYSLGKVNQIRTLESLHK